MGKKTNVESNVTHCGPINFILFFLVLLKTFLLNQSKLKKTTLKKAVILQLYLVSCSSTQWGTSSVRRCACWLTRRCPRLIPDQNWPSPCPRRAPGTWSPSAESSAWAFWGGGALTFWIFETGYTRTMSSVAKYMSRASEEKVRNLKATVEMLGFHLVGRPTAA